MKATLRIDIYLAGGPLEGSRIVVTVEDIGEVPEEFAYRGEGWYRSGPNHTTDGARVYEWTTDVPWRGVRTEDWLHRFVPGVPTRPDPGRRT